MRHLSRVVRVFVFVCTAAGASLSQPKLPLNEPVEPFSIKPGSSFAASGGARSIDSQRPSRITADILEAETIIRANSISGKQLGLDDMMKNALEGALRTLDPHSSYYDA